MTTKKTSRVQRELMDRLTDAQTAVGALEMWLGDPGVITYERLWSSASYTMAAEEMARLEVTPDMYQTAYKRMGFLRRGTTGPALAFVEAVALRGLLPHWATVELDTSNVTIGEIVVGRMDGMRRTDSVEAVQEFDRMGASICIKVQATLIGFPPGSDVPRPLVVVTEKIYTDVLGMRW